MKSSMPENNLPEVLCCPKSACWTHFSQAFGSWRKNISTNWLFVDPRMPVVSLLAFQRSSVASWSRILLNLVPRVFHLRTSRRKTLVWAGHVLWWENYLHGGVPILQEIVATSICHIPNETRAIAMFFASLHSSISCSSYWNFNLKPKQVNCLEAVEIWLLFCPRAMENPSFFTYCPHCSLTKWTLEISLSHHNLFWLWFRRWTLQSEVR